MALDTLKRIGEILREIKDISGESGMPPEIKQSRKLNLTKQLFFQAVPLLPEDFTEANKERILHLEEKKASIYSKRSGNTSQFKSVTMIYDLELEMELDKISIEIQQSLQKEKYFMPPKSDPRVGWKQA